jgi:D-sedoheptulose 7-phosphate isomerase
MSPGRFTASGPHLAALRHALGASELQLARLDGWGGELGERLLAGARLLTAGNGGSAAEAQHLAAELVGRFVDERLPLSALALCTDGAAVTAIGNDYGAEQLFARQVCAHGRPGDVLVVLSTSGRSPNVVAAAHAARDCGLTTWALTGPGPNPLTEVCDDAVCIEADTTATIQELHLVAVHLLCAAVDRRVAQIVGREIVGVVRA